ncbi:hypothetical protein EEL32_00975 [Brevibacillus laterosporus]|nr:transposase family protein [Brevibacillus laterosporus]TPG92973.1 hypothetical protein EEL32_00975 [Brevibacillus laterosporus]
MTTNMLNLPSFKILDMKESEYDYRFLVETILPPPFYCPKCGTVANLYKHGKKEQLFFDLPMHAKRVGIFVKRQRYKCKECEATFSLLTRRKDLTDFDDQIKLQVWTQNFPLLCQAYELKEQFFDIYEANNKNNEPCRAWILF